MMNDWMPSNRLQQIYTTGHQATNAPDGPRPMLKKIPTEQLRVGMYIDSFCGSWMDHPFWRTRFVVRHPQDVELARRSTIRELWIDTDRGADVAPSVPVLEQAHTPEQAQASHRFIRDRVRRGARTPTLLYGGSVKPDNAAGLFAQPDVDGGLIGGASLVADQFLSICKAALPR